LNKDTLDVCYVMSSVLVIIVIGKRYLYAIRILKLKSMLVSKNLPVDYI
jgi:hypothetical protein